MFFVINMDVDTDTKELGHIRHGRILDSVAFARLVKHCEMVDSVAFTSWDRAADYAEEYFPDYTLAYTPDIAPPKKESGFDVADELADITTSELFDELIVRIRETNGLEIVPDRDIAGLVNLLVRHLHPNFLTE